MIYAIKQWLHRAIVLLAMRYLNTADLIAMVDTKLADTQQLDIAIDDLRYIINKHTLEY